VKKQRCRHGEGLVHGGAVPGRGARHRGQLRETRQQRFLRRHAVPPRHRELRRAGGDPLSKDANSPRVGTGGPGYHIKCETKGNPHKHVAGSLSMAHAGKDTGGSQFFVCHGALTHLDGVHTSSGRSMRPG